MAAKDEFRKAYRGDIVGREVIVLDSAVSTNDAAFEIAGSRNTPEGIVVVADEQTGGRGRFGRRWISPPGGNLYFSVILKPVGSGETQLVTLAAAAAVATALREEAEIDAEIKWPNDILVSGRKVCGILAEMRSTGSTPRFLILGIGVNVNMGIDEFDDDLRETASSLKIEKGAALDRGALFSSIVSKLDQFYKFLLENDKAAVMSAWHRLNCTLGKNVSIRDQKGIITGMAEGLNHRGELLVRLSSGDIVAGNSGDVTLL